MKFKLALLICLSTNIVYSQELCPVHDVNVFESLKKIANDLDEQIENQRNKFRESLVKKGIDERNSVLIKSNGELIKELEQR